MSLPLGLYCHVPFCASTCDFCAFYQEEPDRSGVEAYLAGMEKEWERFPAGLPVETMFWGGGTPGVLTARDMQRLGRALLARLPAPPVEWTVEMAPSTVKADKIRALLDLGVNRISLGVQSFSAKHLAEIGRRHSPSQVFSALETCRAAGCGNLNLDLIIAIPGQTAAELEADLRQAARTGVEHISTYCLTFEDDTKLMARLQAGQVAKRSEEEEAALYELTAQVLASEGFASYEISNHARPGRECRHNLNTWEMTEWIGLGPSASSQYQGRRHTNVPDTARWLAGLAAGKPELVDVHQLTDSTLASDALVFGLRMDRGVNLASLAQRFPATDWAQWDPLWQRLAAEGFLHVSGHNIRLSPAGRLLADRIAVHILELAEEPAALS